MNQYDSELNPTDDVQSSDPGRSKDAIPPLSPEEYEKEKEEARESQPTDGHPEKAKKRD